MLLYVFRINAMDFSILKIPNIYKKRHKRNRLRRQWRRFLWLTVGKKISSVLCTQNNQSENNPKNEQIKWNRFAVFVLLFAVQKEILEILLFILSAARLLALVRPFALANVCFVNCSYFICTHVMWDQQLTVFYGPPSTHTLTLSKINILMIQLEKLRPNPFAKKSSMICKVY